MAGWCSSRYLCRGVCVCVCVCVARAHDSACLCLSAFACVVSASGPDRQADIEISQTLSISRSIHPYLSRTNLRTFRTTIRISAPSYPTNPHLSTYPIPKLPPLSSLPHFICSISLSRSHPSSSLCPSYTPTHTMEMFESWPPIAKWSVFVIGIAITRLLTLQCLMNIGRYVARSLARSCHEPSTNTPSFPHRRYHLSYSLATLSLSFCLCVGVDSSKYADETRITRKPPITAKQLKRGTIHESSTYDLSLSLSLSLSIRCYPL